MKLVLGLLFALALCAAPARAETGLLYVPCGYQQITSVSASTALTVPTSNSCRATAAVISVEGAAVRYRDDGVDPTATVGMPIVTGQAFQYSGTLANLRIIQQAPTAIVNVLYYR